MTALTEQPNNRYHLGFTLVELLLVLAIIGILVGISYPSYQHFMIKVRRNDGHMALLDLAARLERYYAEHNSYVGATLDKLGIPSQASPKGYYELAITQTEATTFLISAIPTGAQREDTTCDTLTYNELGQKGLTGTGNLEECW